MSALSYGGLDALAARLDPTGAWDSTTDRVATEVLVAVSRAVEQYTGRRYWKSQADETRYFVADSGTECWVDDLVSITTLAHDDGTRGYTTTWATTDYDLEPANAASDDRPYTRIRMTPQGRYSFPTGLAKGVKIVGVFGWPEVPAIVTDVVLLEASRLLQQSQTPSGVVASAELGRWLVMPDLHPTSKVMLAGLRRWRLGVA